MDFSARRLFDDLARRHPRVTIAVMIASSAALLATSPADPPDRIAYDFQLAGPPARVDLTQTTPNAVLRVTVRAHELGKGDVATTEGALMNITGSLSPVGIDPAVAPSVSVRIGTTSAGPDPEPLVVSSSFIAARALEFTGDCSTFATEDPCVAVATIELARTDAGTSGGAVSVNMTYVFAKFAANSDDPHERVQLPWSIGVTTE